VRQWTGLPVCVGIASTKTLAKLANHIAKKNPQFSGVCDLNAMTTEDRERWFGGLGVGEVWGVGRRLTPKLAELGILTVLELMRADPAMLRSRFSVMMEKTNRELNGLVCIEMEEISPPKKQIVSSRSFGVQVSDLHSLEESVSLYVSRAAEKLRRQKSYTGSVMVFIHTSPFNPRVPYYGNSITVSLPTPTDDTMQIAKAAMWGLKRIFRSGFRYQKAGVLLSEIVPPSAVQTDLFAGQTDGRSKIVMGLMDRINSRLGRGTLHSARQGFTQPWRMKQEHKSPNYTTCWDELPEAVV
jgi:DNA polymerase V